MPLGDGRIESAALLALLREHSREHHLLDFGALAREAGTVVSAVMLGAIAASGLLPFAREHYETVVAAGGRGAAASRRGFALAYERVSASRAQGAYVAQMVGGGESAAVAEAMRPPALPADVTAAFAPAVHAMLSLGHARVLEYQDDTYAALYLQRLARVRDAERASDPTAAQGWATTRETARWLALWMAFDDIVRVAELSSGPSAGLVCDAKWGPATTTCSKSMTISSPGARVHRPVAAFAGTRPAALGCTTSRTRRVLWALPLQLGTHTVFGTLLLRLLSAQRWLRRRGQRYAEEQALIDRWLDSVVRHTGADWRLGHEIALCGRLIKGYGSTNQRGRDNLPHIIEQLAERAPFATAAERARAIAQARGARWPMKVGLRSMRRCAAMAPRRGRCRRSDPLRPAREKFECVTEPIESTRSAAHALREHQDHP